jgi:hypothetical protein
MPDCHQLVCFTACSREAATEGPAFSMAGRPNNAPASSAPDDTPGPGHYSTAAGASAATGGAAAPAWTIAGRVPDAAAAAAAAKAHWPGPGSYELGGPGAQGPAYSIQGKAKATGMPTVQCLCDTSSLVSATIQQCGSKRVCLCVCGWLTGCHTVRQPSNEAVAALKQTSF